MNVAHSIRQENVFLKGEWMITSILNASLRFAKGGEISICAKTAKEDKSMHLV